MLRLAEIQNGPEIDDFRPVFYWNVGWRWLPTDRSRTAFGHTGGHTRDDANVCLSSTRWATLIAVKYFAWNDAKNAKPKTDRGIGFEDSSSTLNVVTCQRLGPPVRLMGVQCIFVVRREG